MLEFGQIISHKGLDAVILCQELSCSPQASSGFEFYHWVELKAKRKCFFLSREDRHTCVCVCCICTHECVCVSARSCVFLLQDNCIENLSEWMHSVNPNSATSIFTLCLSLPQSLTLEKKWNEHSRTVCGTQSLSQPYPGESAFPLDCCIALWCIYCDDNSSDSQDTGHTLHTLHTEPRSADLTHVISFHPGCYHLNPTGKWRDREADSVSKVFKL